jgi:hypothetical protein
MQLGLNLIRLNANELTKIYDLACRYRNGIKLENILCTGMWV